MATLHVLRRWPLLCGILLLFLTACGTTTGGNPVVAPMTIPQRFPAGEASLSGGTIPAATVAMPPTQTSCPANGTARAAIMAPLALGKHATLVYIVNEQANNAPTFGTLKSYNVASGAKAEILKLASTSISEAQVSTDGQWLLFVATVSQRTELQLVRMDGKGLQTLYCTPTSPNGPNPGAISHVQWSTDQKLIAFDGYSNNGGALFVLNAKTGELQRDLYTPGSGTFYVVRTWLDTAQLYITDPLIDAPASSVFILNTNLGGNQTRANLRQVLNESASQFCWDFDSSYNGKQLFASQCKATPDPTRPGPYSLSGPSQVTAGSATGGGARVTLLSNPTLAITSLRAVTANTLLLQTASTTNATANNGLWKGQTNGSGLTQLISFGGGVGATGQSGTLNRYGQYPWSNVSRDGSLYAFEEDNSVHNTNTLLFGSLNGGTPTTFASISASTQLSIVGWTTM